MILEPVLYGSGCTSIGNVSFKIMYRVQTRLNNALDNKVQISSSNDARNRNSILHYHFKQMAFAWFTDLKLFS